MTMRYKQTWMTKALLSLNPKASFTITDGVLNWLDSSPEPTKEEIENEMRRLIANEPIKKAKESRQGAYQRESDPLYFKSQRGEIDEQQWINKVSEIKERYPYSEVTQEMIDNVEIFEEVIENTHETKSPKDLLLHIPKNGRMSNENPIL